MPHIDTLLDQLDTLRRECEAAMLDYTGSATMCQIHKDGRVTGGLKYQEGRLVVLGSVIRQIRQRAQADSLPGLLDSILSAEAARWSAQLARYQAAERPAITWVAYSQGGLDTVQEIRHSLLENGITSGQ